MMDQEQQRPGTDPIEVEVSRRFTFPLEAQRPVDPGFVVGHLVSTARHHHRRLVIMLVDGGTPALGAGSLVTGVACISFIRKLPDRFRGRASRRLL